MLQKA
ncbi:hypothetical protein Nmel_015232, partial [Mimus melanotis]